MAIIFIILSAVLNADVFYNLDVEIKPDDSFIRVNATVNFDRKRERFDFYLDKNVVFEKTDSSLTIGILSRENLFKNIAYLKKGGYLKKISLSYRNRFKYPFIGDDNYARGIKNTKGLISADGCFLNADSGWYPVTDERILGFDITIKIPQDYDVVMPGNIYKKEIIDGYKIIRYRSDAPIYDIPLVCGLWKEYFSKGSPDIYVYLKSDDDKLAEKYIEYSKMYIKMYSDMIGRYPYSKFVVVENFWETGYAFPSFTLLGPSVIKLPFIFITSLPHEILHNWWGNGVYPDYSKGNWSEGITSYLSDYLLSEQKGKGRDYRIGVCKKYTDYVSDDIPLFEFRERHSNESEAVGYGKSMMFFHMLRNIVGDKSFIDSLRSIYSKNKFNKISWKEIRDEFERISGKRLDDFFDIFVSSKYFCTAQIIKESLKVDNTNLSLDISGYCPVEIPLEIFYSNGKKDVHLIKLDGSRKSFSFRLDGDVAGLCLDCGFNILRKLLDGEVAVSFSKILSQPSIGVISEYDLLSLKPPFLKTNLDLPGFKFYVGKKIYSQVNLPYISFTSSSFILNGKTYDLDENYVFFVVEDSSSVKGYAFCDDKCDSFLNKIIHYGKYSYIITDRFYNVIETGQWDLKERENTVFLKEKIDNFREKTLWSMPSFFSIDKLRKDSFFLSSKLRTRHPGSREIERAADYIENEFRKAKLQPFFKNSYRQYFNAEVSSKSFSLVNICAKTSESERYILVSAHYDHLFPQGDIYYPGANDNSSGVSVMLELARYALSKKVKNLAFCAFSGEEYGFKGSDYFASLSSSNIKAVLNIDTVGRIKDGKVIVLNYETSSQWKQILRKASLSSGIEVVFGPLGLTSGDQISFIKRKIPAIQLYDGGVDDYHRPTDTFDKLDFDGMLMICGLSFSVIEQVLEKEIVFDDFEHRQIKGRKISLGFAPDFEYSGVGVRIKRINQGSILSTIPISQGDVITAVNGIVIKNIYDYIDALSNVDVAKAISIECLCGGERKKFSLYYH